MVKIAIYTAIFGDKDELKDPTNYSSENGIDYFLITDNKETQSLVYNIIVKKPTYDDITKNARYYKVNGLEIFNKYDYVIWHDANIQIIDDKIIKLIASIKNKEILLFKHPERKCTYDEAIKCIELEKDYPLKVLKQVLYYYKNGIKNNAGLFASGLFVLNRKFINQEFLNLWWNEIEQRSRRDQLSLPYALKVHNIQPIIIEDDIRDNDYSNFHNHKHKKYIFLSIGKPKGFNKTLKKLAIALIKLIKKTNKLKM